MSKLYLIPTPISEDISGIPPQSIEIIRKGRVFICERIRTTRRFIKTILKEFDIDRSLFIEIDKRGDFIRNDQIVSILENGTELCFMSEAGSPCVADPGASLVNLARQYNYQILPLSGPSALMLALMASGMDGQHFTFRGYLPVKQSGLQKELKLIEKIIQQSGYTQMFIETPYRNLQMLEAILNTVQENLRLNISYGLHTSIELSDTQTIRSWKKDKKIRRLLEEKTPCIFILGR